MNADQPDEQRAMEQLLPVLLTAANVLAESERGALARAWGRHLLEDWRSLELLAERLR